MKKIWILIVLLICPIVVLADNMTMGGPNATTNNLGIAATNLNSVIAFIYDILDVILFIGAAILGMSGLLKYRLHRQNPQQVPLSTPVTELSLAGVLIILAVLVQMSASNKTVTNPNLPNINAPGGHRAAPAPNNAYPY
ncbi:MAG: hypothetical protein ABSF18_02130 [Gammaproteobacteria bacterium]|jgi:hypothetical protein